MKKAFFALMAAAAFSLTSCDPTFDKDNPKESMDEMCEDLSASEKEELGKAVFKLAMKAGSESELAEQLDGKTAEEIIEMAK